MNLCAKISALKGRFSTGVGKRVKLFTIFAIHGACNHLFLFCQFFYVNKDTSLKFPYGIKKVFCPRNSYKITFKNKTVYFTMAICFRMGVQTLSDLNSGYIFLQRLNILYYIG